MFHIAYIFSGILMGLFDSTTIDFLYIALKFQCTLKVYLTEINFAE